MNYNASQVGSALGANTSLNQTFLAVLAVVRSKQLIAEGG